MKNLLFSLIYCVFFCLQSFTLFAVDKVIAPHQIILQTSYKSKITLPPFADHSFDLQYPTVYEAYQPQWYASEFVILEEKPIQHWAISDITKTFPWMGKLMLGDRGKYEAGVLLFQQQKWEEAGKLFDTISNHSSIWGEYALLWESWSLYKEKRYAFAKHAVQRLWKAKNRNLRQEAFYLSFVLALKQKEVTFLEQIFIQTKQLDDFKTWNNNLKAAFIVAQGEAKHWQSVLNYIHIWERQRPMYIPTYYQIEELKALSYYMLRNYRESRSTMLSIRSYVNFEVIQAKGRELWLWLNYFTNHCEVQTQSISKYGYPENRSKDEMVYLSLLCQLQTKKWQLARVSWNKIQPSSLFFKYATYSVYMSTSLTKTPHMLYTKAKKKMVLEGNLGFYAMMIQANALFNAGKFTQAYNLYSKAATLDVNIKDTWLLSYNQGLTALQQHQYKIGQKVFATSFLKDKKWQKYHLLYSLFQLKNYQVYKASFNKKLLSEYPIQEKTELIIMQAVSLWKLGEEELAISFLQQQLQQNEDFQIAVYYAHMLYESNQYEKVVQFTQKLLSKTPLLYEYELEALFQQDKLKKAEKVIDQAQLKTSDLIALRIRILTENKSYSKLKQYLLRLLAQVSLPSEKIKYYRLLSNTSFNQKKYKESYLYLQKATQYAKTKPVLVDIEYDQLLVLNQYHNKKLFLKIAQNIYNNFAYLNEDKKYNANALMTDFWLDEGNYIMADKLMKLYMQKKYPDYTKVYIKQLYVKILLRDNEVCMALAANPPKLTTKNNIDRILLASQCASKKIDKIKIAAWLNEVQTQEPEYRTTDRLLVSLHIYDGLGEAKSTIKIGQALLYRKLLIKDKNTVKLILAKAYASKYAYRTAKRILPPLQVYEDSPQEYNEAADIYATLYAKKKDYKAAITMKLHILFSLSNKQEKAKQTLYIDIAELYLKQANRTKTKQYLQKVTQVNDLSRKDKSRYRLLQIKLSQKKATK